MFAHGIYEEIVTGLVQRNDGVSSEERAYGFSGSAMIVVILVYL